jgi:predicted DNA binding CopG/RHH family protein
MKRKMKLTRYEREIEAASERGEYVDADPQTLKKIAAMLEVRKKDAVLNIRINNGDLQSLKQKAAKLGVKYQTFISEILHRVAQG